MIETFGAVAVALYAAHHVGDYWVQTDHQAGHKGKPGKEGRWAAFNHVMSYVITQWVFLIPFGGHISLTRIVLGLLVSGVTHYMADRREYGLMFRLARWLPGKTAFLELGRGVPTLGTGAWALDQSWHIFWGVFVAGLVISY